MTWIYTYTILLKSITEIIPAFNQYEGFEIRTQYRNVRHWCLKRPEMREIVSLVMGESQKYQATTSPPPSMRRWVRAGGSNRARVSSCLCRAPSHLTWQPVPPPPRPASLPRPVCAMNSQVDLAKKRWFFILGCLMPAFLKGTWEWGPLWGHK